MTYNHDELRANVEYIGIRWMTEDEQYEIGDACRPSFDWDYENDCSSFDTENPIELDGTCCIRLNIEDDDSNEDIDAEIERVLSKYHYWGTPIIIKGTDFEYGADEDEIILEGAEVIGK
jgi:hypothetical protein